MKISTELQREVIAELFKNGVTIAAASAPIVISSINRLTVGGCEGAEAGKFRVARQDE